ncbi:MAG: glutathione S-transferase domain protein [Burkholderiales bacterium]|jgi:glutathione S-transferase|nr:glutathione S-transferase domain protein [Burkholderiales bacterium]
MKLYYHPVSTTSRPVILFAMENNLPVEFQVVDLMKGEHVQPPYAAINPSKLVPVLEDGDFRLTESSAILKYLAEKSSSPAYPKDLRERARVNERMDWINTQLCRDLAYGLVYPQIFPTHKRPTDEHQKGQLAWAKERAQSWMKVLDESLIGKQPYLCGDKITIADYFASSFVSLAEFIRADFSAYPNLKRWYERMKGLKSWNKVHEVFYGFAGSMRDAKFEVV